MRKNYQQFLNELDGQCPLCDPAKYGNKIIRKMSKMTLMENKFPYCYGHMLIITNAHKSKYTELDIRELKQLSFLISIVSSKSEKKIQMLINEGGDSIRNHFHMHLIPYSEFSRLRMVIDNEIII